MTPLPGPTARLTGELPPWLWALPSVVEVLRALCHQAGNAGHGQGWDCADVDLLRGCTGHGRLCMQEPYSCLSGCDSQIKTTQTASGDVYLSVV